MKFTYQSDYHFLFTGITWVPTTYRIYNYVMDSDSNIMWCSSFGFSLVANIHVMFNTHKMFIASCPKDFSGGMCYFVLICLKIYSYNVVIVIGNV